MNINAGRSTLETSLY